jgi:hypothetical protein
MVTETAVRASARVGLSQGYFAIVDESDLDLLAGHKWFALFPDRRNPRVYAAAKIGGRNVMMHRFLVGASAGSDVDHRDGDGLNNRRSNLRECSRSENQMNQRPRGGTSRFKGVYLHARSGKWAVKIKRDGKFYWLGYHADEEVAARKYDEAARRIFGEFACLNFPG